MGVRFKVCTTVGVGALQASLRGWTRNQHGQWVVPEDAAVTENEKHRSGKKAVDQGLEALVDEEG